MNDVPDIPSLVQAEQSFVRLPTRLDWIEPAVEYLCRKAVLCGACEEAQSKKLMVALQEALANAVVHGNLELSSELKEQGDGTFAEALAQRAADPRLSERSIDVAFDYDGRRCRWIITDQGRGFDVPWAMARAASDDPDVLLASGRGILIMRSFLDEVRYEEGGRRLILTLERRWGEEKRDHARLDMTLPLRVAPIRADGSVDWDAAYQAIAVNFSREGVGLLQERLAASDRILIGISGNSQPIYIPAEVRHCRNLGGDVVELGCRFQVPAEAAGGFVAGVPLHDPDLNEAIARLLEKHAGPPIGEDERREHPRAAFKARIEVLRSPGAEPIVGFARDLSKGGLACVTTVAMPTGDVVILLPHEPDQPLHVRARIVRCNKIEEGFYDVGARFLRLEDARKRS